MIFTARNFSLVIFIYIKSSTSGDRLVIAIDSDILFDGHSSLTILQTCRSIQRDILKQLNSFSILCFRNRRCQIAVEVSSLYIQSDNTGLMIWFTFYKNIICVGCRSYFSIQRCAINQCNGRKCRVIGDVTSNLCIVGNNYGRRIFFGAIRYNHITSDRCFFTGYG